MKKITAVVVVCCFLNSVLYAPAWAVASYARTFDNISGLAPNALKRNQAILNTFPAFAMFSRLTGEAEAHPEAFDSQAFIRAWNGCGAADTVKFEKIKPFIDTIENMQSAEPEALLKQALEAIDACSARIDTENAAPSAAVLLSMLNAVRHELQNAICNNPEALHLQTTDNQTGFNLDRAEDVYWLCANVVHLNAVISMFGIGTSTAVSLLEFILMLRIVAYASKWAIMKIIVKILIGNPIEIAPELLQLLMFLTAIVAVYGRLFASSLVIAYYVSGLFEGHIDLLVLNWILEFSINRGHELLFH